MEVSIRRAEQKDFDDVVRLNKALFDFEAQFNHAFDVNWPYAPAGQMYFKKRFAEEDAFIYVAEHEGNVVGYIISFLTSYAYRSVNPFCVIENMFVEEAYRAQGVGKRLVASVRKSAKGRGAKRLRVDAIAQNEKALEFYHTVGFGDVTVELEETIQ